jgi:hypothetical protein
MMQNWFGHDPRLMMIFLVAVACAIVFGIVLFWR